jgi:ATP-dependent RNA helicase RhlE
MRLGWTASVWQHRPPQQKKVTSKMNFSELGLPEPLLRALDALGYESATPIQVKAIPHAVAGCDLVGCAQTGTGKTAAFTLPMLDRLMRTAPGGTGSSTATDDQRTVHDRRAVARRATARTRLLRALVLSPTRELAVQIGESFGRYGRFTSLRQTVVYGGVSQSKQLTALRHGVDTLIATPGRLLDLMGQGHIDLSRVEILILDEADRMLDMGFLPALKRIVASVPTRRQTMMFSATMPDDIRRIAAQWLKNPVAVEVAPPATPVERVTQSVYLVDVKRKADLLTWFLKEIPGARTLVFSRTKHGADKIVKHLNNRGLCAAAIHGNKSQSARSRTLARFKADHPPVLVATDVAARGLDIDKVSHVVNFDLPEVPETYIHRIGRTARAGAEGVAVSFCAGHERQLLKQIEKLISRTISVEPTVDGFKPTEPLIHPESTAARPTIRRRPPLRRKQSVRRRARSQR